MCMVYYFFETCSSTWPSTHYVGWPATWGNLPASVSQALQLQAYITTSGSACFPSLPFTNDATTVAAASKPHYNDRMLTAGLQHLHAGGLTPSTEHIARQESWEIKAKGWKLSPDIHSPQDAPAKAGSEGKAPGWVSQESPPSWDLELCLFHLHQSNCSLVLD